MNLWPDKHVIEQVRDPFRLLSYQADAFDYSYSPLIAHARACLDTNTCKLSISDSGQVNMVDILEIHNAFDYPCKVHFDGKAKRCRTEAELIGELARVFNSQKVKIMIADLMK